MQPQKPTLHYWLSFLCSPTEHSLMRNRGAAHTQTRQARRERAVVNLHVVTDGGIHSKLCGQVLCHVWQQCQCCLPSQVAFQCPCEFLSRNVQWENKLMPLKGLWDFSKLSCPTVEVFIVPVLFMCLPCECTHFSLCYVKNDSSTFSWPFIIHCFACATFVSVMDKVCFSHD